MRIIILFSVLFTFISGTSLAQSKFAGDWKGTLNVGQELDLIFHITEENGNLAATMDVPAQGAAGIATSGVTVTGDEITISVNAINGTYSGTMKDEGHISGNWSQAGMKMPLDLTRTTEKTVLKRPQTPQPPFSYNSEEVVYRNQDRSVQYGATITTPKDDKQHPAIILISGSGQQNRDGEIMGHKLFAVIADHLTQSGYVVLRVDDRGIGKTTGDVKSATSEDFAGDVLNGIEYLKTRKEVNRKKIGLIGHSEGGMIAPIVATKSKDVAFIVMMAGPGVTGAEVLEQQNEALLKKAGMPDEWVAAYVQLYGNIMEIISTAKNKEQAQQQINDAVTAWKQKQDGQTVQNTTGITDEASQQKFVNEFVKVYESPWFRYFIQYNPRPYLEKLTGKVLAINGSEDIQALPKPNLAGIEAALKNSKVKSYETYEIKGVNHLFQECKTCTPQEYGQLEQTIKPEVLDIITAWLDKNVK